MTSDDVTTILNSELARIADEEIFSCIKPLLVTPSQHSRILSEQSAERQYSCWTVLQDASYDTAIVYLETPLIPGACWALVSLSGRFLGDDSGWFQHLEDAFADSWPAASLRVWDVLRRSRSASTEILHKNMTLNEACEILNQLNRPFRENPGLSSKADFHYTIELRSKHRPSA
jgi:hypothetical protein